MSGRVTPNEVRDILSTTATDAALNIAIDAANALVTDTVAAHADAPGAATLKLIERFVAAHFVTPQDPQASQVGMGDVRVTFEGESGRGLEETRYGRRAIDLDPTHTLKDIGKPSALFETFGHDSSDW